ncbi:Testisin [Halocaridina rubra]|uniref:limulus clotting factor C n=1 Tax=Halocaridina rubra TaxID=373956 RepID=A0AAN9A4H0_HALRR
MRLRAQTLSGTLWSPQVSRIAYGVPRDFGIKRRGHPSRLVWNVSSRRKSLRLSCLSRHNCGVSQVTVPRIVGGEEATPGEYPWQVALVIGSSICGGTLIKTDWVLTAAHCFVLTGESSANVIFGAHDITSVSTDPNVIAIASSSVTTHPDYDDISQNNDIALVYLGQDVTFNNRIKPICLSQAGDFVAGDKLVTTGWGVTESGGEVSSKLREVSLDAISNSECSSLYQNSFTITSNMICTLTPSKDACQGDSGGPLIRQLQDGTWVQVGIVSFGLGCGEATNPGVFAKVSNYIDWITTTTGDASC